MVRSDWAWRHTASPAWMVPLMTIPGGNPVTAGGGDAPRFPLIPLGPVLVTPAPANTAKLSAVPRPTGASWALVALVTISAARLSSMHRTSSGPWRLLPRLGFTTVAHRSRLSQRRRRWGGQRRYTI